MQEEFVEDVIEKAITSIDDASRALERYCNELENFNASSANLIEQMSWSLLKQANELREIKYMYGT